MEQGKVAPQKPAVPDIAAGDAQERSGGGVLNYSTNYDIETHSFDEMDLPQDLLRGVYSHGFEKPSSIQQRAIVPLLEGHDVIAQAQSGTGKTGAFVIAALARMDVSRRECQALVLAPTRELAAQINGEVVKLGRHMGVQTHACVGGTAVRGDMQCLNAGVHMVVGTPGRVGDMLEKGHLRVDLLKIFILDEADEMLDRGFEVQVYKILKNIGLVRQRLADGTEVRVQLALFSATMPLATFNVGNRFMSNPLRILVKNEELTLEGIQQFFVDVGQDHFKFEVLQELYGLLPIQQAIIYCNSRLRVDRLALDMGGDGHRVSALHSEMTQSTRAGIMEEFRRGHTRVLVTTDLLARGIDVQSVSLVVNFDLPGNHESYIHRIGRSGRFGRRGMAINLIHAGEAQRLRDLESHYSTEIRPLPEIKELVAPEAGRTS